MKFILVILVAALASVSEARADLLAGGCAVVASNSVSGTQYASADDLVMPEMAATWKIPGVSCEQLSQFQDAGAAIGIALIPLNAVMALPSVKNALAAEAVAIGAAIGATPAVLAVTFVGAVGVVTSYVLVRASIEECKQMNKPVLQKDLYKDLETRYGLKPLSSIPLEIRN